MTPAALTAWIGARGRSASASMLTAALEDALDAPSVTDDTPDSATTPDASEDAPPSVTEENASIGCSDRNCTPTVG